MNDQNPLDKNRRKLLGTGLALGAVASTAIAAPPRKARTATQASALGINSAELGLKPSNTREQSGAFQYAIDKANERNSPLLLAPGNYLASGLTMRNSSQIIGVAHKSRIIFSGNGTCISARDAKNITLSDLKIDGNAKPLDLSKGADGLLSLSQCDNIDLHNLEVSQSLVNGISLRQCTGRATDITINNCTNTGLFSLDAKDLQLNGMIITECKNNGIQIWRSNPGHDGTIISDCHIRNINALAGGSGQNGNGINIFRAGSVTITDNQISNCAFSAIRGNAASNLIISNNNCSRLGEVALYAEFGFEGALIANNIVDDAATGISVTNFNDGGRLAIVQGNLVRNLKRREQSEDKRGTGISVEADTAVIGNIIENAPTMGLRIGWGKYMRDVSATGNIIRNTPIGIGISTDQTTNLVHVANNLISGVTNGGIRAMSHDKPIGPDLIISGTGNYRNIALMGNVAS